MAFIDYYKILGLNKNASADDIRKAYRKLARQHHPDLNPNDKQAHAKFQQINEAHEVLSDPEKRKKYDEYGEHWKHAEQFEEAKQRNAQQDSGGWEQAFSGETGGEHFSDFFESLFGNRGGPGRRSGRPKFRGEDYQAELHVGLLEAYREHQHTITVNGQHIRITVPAGIADRQVIKLKGRGGPGVNDGPNGDLYITFIIGEDPVFKRLNDDLYLTVTIDLYTALLGGEQNIETPDGKIKLKVSPETQPGTKVRLKGKGFPVYKKAGSFGDLFVTYSVKLPSGLTEKQKQLIRELAASS